MKKQATVFVAFATVAGVFIGEPAKATQYTGGPNWTYDVLSRTTSCTSNSNPCNVETAYALNTNNDYFFYNNMIWYNFSEIVPGGPSGGSYYTIIQVHCSKGDNPISNGGNWMGPYTQSGIPPQGGQFAELCANGNDPSDTATYSVAAGWIT